MSLWLSDIAYPLSRWLHLVCTTLIVGGTLFFELVLPIATEELKKEQEFYVFARARLVFRWVVWLGVAGLMFSGTLSLYRMWEAYQRDAFYMVSRWAVAHMILGAIGMLIAVLLTIGKEPPANPLKWMRFNLIVLLVTIFLGSATYHFQLQLTEDHPRNGRGRQPPTTMPGAESEPPATKPAK